MGKRKVKEKHYPNMEEVLQYIGKKYIKVDKGRIRSANQYLSRVLCKVTSAMKRASPLFRAMFTTFLYAGSSFDGLKIGKPDEYDIDLLLFLPEILDVRVHPSDRDGFVHIELKDWDRLRKDKKLYTIYRELEEFKDNKNYLSQEKIKTWMQSIVDKAKNEINDSGTFDDELDIKPITISGPAVTLHVTKSGKKIMDIDLVAVFRMPERKWPAYPVRKNSSDKKESLMHYILSKKDYVVVPKPPKVIDNMHQLSEQPERYWRLSFPEEEMDFMNDYNFLKPALRLLKKLRDTHTHNIPSYFIKTIFLWEVQNTKETKREYFWRQSLTYVFLEMLEKYKTYLEKHEIFYFWAEKNNFLLPYSKTNINNIRDYLETMISNLNRIERKDAVIVAKYLLPANEYEEVCQHFNYIPTL